jgi:DegV family protein with EDD domain
LGDALIALVTDSNSQIPPSLVERFSVTVVPLHVTVDGVTYLEGVDLEADDFYARFDKATPSVTTSQPSPGQFAAAYDHLVAEGAAEILSVHIGSAVSGTVNSARLAATETAVPVRVVDTGTASFAVTLCVWAAADALARGADAEVAARAAEQTAAGVGNVFVVRTLDLARAGGRLSIDAPDPAVGKIPVLTIADGTIRVVGQAADHDEVVDVIGRHVRAGGRDLRVGVGVADRAVAGYWDLIEARLTRAPEVGEVVRYRIGPSVGAHTGPGTVGVLWASAR